MNVQNLVRLESDDSCAICGERRAEHLTYHHIEGRSDSYDNLILLCYNCHGSHNDKRSPSTCQIKSRKRHLIQKTITTYGLSAMKIAGRREGYGVPAIPFLLYLLVDMGLMRKEQWLMKAGPGDRIETLALFKITPEGKALLKKWFNKIADC